MKLIRDIFLLFLFLQTIANANEVKLFFKNSQLYNGETALLLLESFETLKEPKLTFDGLNINFSKHPLKQKSYFAFIPIDYYKKTQRYKVIVSYKINNQKIFKGIYFKVEEGPYKSETIKVSKSKIELNNKDKARTKKEYEEAMHIYHHISSNSLISLSFSNPLQTKITSSFGTKRVYNNIMKSYHSGTDYQASIGTVINASSPGIVKIAQNRFYAGNSVVIDHGYGVYTGYYHLSKILVKRNQYLKEGEQIGLSGKTGRVTGPHLHFSLRVHGIQVNPLQFIETTNHLMNL